MGIKKFIINFIISVVIILFFSIALAQETEEVIDIDLIVNQDGSVIENWIILTEGLRTEYHQIIGDYSLKVEDIDSNIVWNQTLDIHFDYSGPMFVGVDYSSLRPTNYYLTFRIPYSSNMHELRIYHGEDIIFSRVLNFCNSNSVCDGSETFESCPQDCPLDNNDVICIPDEDGLCDPDCGQGVDPDCEEEFYPYAGEDKEVKAGRLISFVGEVINAGSGTYSYSWFFEDDGSTVTGQEAIHTFAENGVFAVTLTVTNQDGVSKEDTLLVTVSGLSCEMIPDVCDDVSVFKIESLTNSHAQLSGNYPYTVCCSGVSGLSTDSSGTAVLSFAEENNAHVQKSSISTYSYGAYLSAPSDIACNYVESSDDGYSACEDAGFDTCLASMQNSDNSHIGDCNAYSIKVCCKVGEESGFWSWLGFSWLIDYFDKIL